MKGRTEVDFLKLFFLMLLSFVKVCMFNEVTQMFIDTGKVIGPYTCIKEPVLIGANLGWILKAQLLNKTLCPRILQGNKQ